MSDVLWKWPVQARVGRTIPKAKFYEKAKVSSRVRDAFVSEVDTITWAYKLASLTLPIKSTSDIPEIQVFTITAKPDREVSDAVLTVIDGSVQTPIIFEDLASRGVRTRAAGKQLSSKGIALGRHFQGEWMDSESARSQLPQAMDLASLYGQLLGPLLPLSPRAGESLSETLGRIDAAASLERKIKALQSRMAKEPQLNRKMEIRRELLGRIEEFEALTAT